MISQFCGSFCALIRRSLLTVIEYWPVNVAMAATTMTLVNAAPIPGPLRTPGCMELSLNEIARY